MSSRRHLIVGTAGHIDHGKSRLVETLTGTDPDRLKEEKRRGITIELGFADLELDPERIVSFVDVPGHERFVRRMVAGATGLDAVLLVVAADAGVQPQTREHLQICELLRVRHGIVAVTKCDLVDEDLLEVVQLELAELLAGTGLAGVPTLPVSSLTGEGIDRLREELGALFARVPPRQTGGLARLPVDRSFVLQGFGTVVTGTLLGGRLGEGDEVEVLPGGARGRVRGLQVHHQKVPRAVAGQRTAVNLAGLDRDAVPRGSTLVHPGTIEATRRVWARVELLPGAPEELRRAGPLRFHAGTCEREGRLRALGPASDDGSFLAEIRLFEPVALLPGDRFILRRPAPVDTVGGGRVVDARPPRARREHVEAWADDDADVLTLTLRRAGLSGRDAAALAVEIGRPLRRVEEELERRREGGSLTTVAGVWFDRGQWEALARRVDPWLAQAHRRHPLAEGISREEARNRHAPTMPREAWRQWLEERQAAGAIRLLGRLVALADHEVRLSDEQRRTIESLESRFRRAGLDPPGGQALIDELDPSSSALLELLLDRGVLVKLGDGRLFHREALERLKERLRAYAAESSTIDVGTFKELAGVSRKSAIPLLEYLDSLRMTRRAGNVREILSS